MPHSALAPTKHRVHSASRQSAKANSICQGASASRASSGQAEGAQSGRAVLATGDASLSAPPPSFGCPRFRPLCQRTRHLEPVLRRARLSVYGPGDVWHRPGDATGFWGHTYRRCIRCVCRVVTRLQNASLARLSKLARLFCGPTRKRKASPPLTSNHPPSTEGHEAGIIIQPIDPQRCGRSKEPAVDCISQYISTRASVGRSKHRDCKAGCMAVTREAGSAR